MSNFDSDMGWMDSAAMKQCTCTHFQRSHRPISRKCSLCDCPQFTPQEKTAATPAQK